MRDRSFDTTGDRTGETSETAWWTEDCVTQRPDAVLTAYRDSVYGFVLRRVGDRSLADDLTQEVFLRAERSIGTYRREASLKSWMFAIALNVVRDHFRALHRAPDSPSLVMSAGQASPGEGAEAALLGSEIASCDDGYLSQLPRHQNDVVSMHDMDGLTHAEIATVLGVSVANSRVLLHRGRAALRRMLDENCLLSFGGESIPCERKPATEMGGKHDSCACEV